MRLLFIFLLLSLNTIAQTLRGFQIKNDKYVWSHFYDLENAVVIQSNIARRIANFPFMRVDVGDRKSVSGKAVEVPEEEHKEDVHNDFTLDVTFQQEGYTVHVTGWVRKQQLASKKRPITTSLETATRKRISKNHKW